MFLLQASPPWLAGPDTSFLFKLQRVLQEDVKTIRNASVRQLYQLLHLIATTKATSPALRGCTTLLILPIFVHISNLCFVVWPLATLRFGLCCTGAAVINSNQHLGIEFSRSNLLCCCPFPSIAAISKWKIQVTSNNKGSHV